MKISLIIITIAVALLMITAPSRNHDLATPQSSAPVDLVEARPELKITVAPDIIIQGEPFKITVENSEADVSGISFDEEKLRIFKEGDAVVALGGFDLNKKAGEYKLVVTFDNGTSKTESITIGSRPKIEAPLGIPDKLGGNTPESQRTLIATLADEAKIINTIPTDNSKLWNSAFRMPVETVYITDDYGYSRQTGQLSIAHKGTDFRAREGTPIYAMNDGVVKLVQSFRNYGKTIALDHGVGIQTLYLHLSEFKVKEGDVIRKGDVIGLSGSTGYAEAAHLHLTIKVNGISIDPMKFITLLN